MANVMIFLWNPGMEFVQNFTLPDYQAKNFTPSIPPNFNSKKKHKKMSENGEIYTAGNKFYTAACSDATDKFHLCWLVYVMRPLFEDTATDLFCPLEWTPTSISRPIAHSCTHSLLINENGPNQSPTFGQNR